MLVRIYLSALVMLNVLSVCSSYASETMSVCSSHASETMSACSSHASETMSVFLVIMSVYILAVFLF